MKKISYLTMFGLLSFALLMSACKKDKEESNLNQFTLNGETYSLDKGFLVEYGQNTDGSYDWDVTLTSPSIDYSESLGDFTGQGDAIYMDLNTSSATGLVAGTYNYSTDRNAFTFVDALGATDAIISSGTGNFVNLTAGTIDVSINGTATTFDIDLVTSTGQSLTGNFTGTLARIQ